MNASGERFTFRLGRREGDVFDRPRRMEQVWGLASRPPKNSHLCDLQRCDHHEAGA